MSMTDTPTYSWEELVEILLRNPDLQYLVCQVEGGGHGAWRTQLRVQLLFAEHFETGVGCRFNYRRHNDRTRQELMDMTDARHFNLPMSQGFKGAARLIRATETSRFEVIEVARVENPSWDKAPAGWERGDSTEKAKENAHAG